MVFRLSASVIGVLEGDGDGVTICDDDGEGEGIAEGDGDITGPGMTIEWEKNIIRIRTHVLEYIYQLFESNG